MKYKLSRQQAIATFILSNLFTIVACQPGAAISTTVPMPTTETQIINEPTLIASPTLGPSGFNLPDPKVGLSDLSSYRATLTLSFEGTQTGEPAQWERTYVMVASQEPAARQVTVETAGEATSNVFEAEINGALFERQGENACTVSIIEEGESISDLWEPAGFLNGVGGAAEAGGETINGIATDHYTVDAEAIGGSGIAESAGEMWIASGGGYLVKYVLTTQANADYFGEGTEGTATWDYALTEVNEPLVIEPPEDCPPGMLNVPILPEAVDVVNVPGMLTYTTPTSVAEAAAFYQEQLPSLGWQVQESSETVENMALLDFTQNNQLLSVVIIADETGTTVLIEARTGQP